MGMRTRESVPEKQPYRVVKDGDIISDHKYSGQAITEARVSGASHVHYLNHRGFGAVVWAAEWEQSAAAPVIVETGGYL